MYRHIFKMSVLIIKGNSMISVTYINNIITLKEQTVTCSVQEDSLWNNIIPWTAENGFITWYWDRFAQSYVVNNRKLPSGIAIVRAKTHRVIFMTDLWLNFVRAIVLRENFLGSLPFPIRESLDENLSRYFQYKQTFVTWYLKRNCF